MGSKPSNNAAGNDNLRHLRERLEKDGHTVEVGQSTQAALKDLLRDLDDLRPTWPAPRMPPTIAALI